MLTRLAGLLTCFRSVELAFGDSFAFHLWRLRAPHRPDDRRWLLVGRAFALDATRNIELWEAPMTAKRGSGKRELIEPNGDKRYVRRDANGKLSESDDTGRSLSQDRKRKAKTKAKPGYGDRGDRKR